MLNRIVKKPYFGCIDMPERRIFRRFGASPDLIAGRSAAQAVDAANGRLVVFSGYIACGHAACRTGLAGRAVRINAIVLFLHFD